MTCQNDFYIWLYNLLEKNNLDKCLSERFKFLSYDEYNSSNPTNRLIIYEDWWRHKSDIVKSKVSSLLKLNKKVYGRNCIAKKIDKPTSDKFLEKHHLFGTTNSKVKFGLFYKYELFAAATFAAQRQFINGRSVELLRYCSKSDYTVIGGLDKLLNAYIKEYKPSEIMTYIDQEWGTGESFINIGFKRTGSKAPMSIFINKNTGIRIPEKHFYDFDRLNEYLKIKNGGSIKMVRKCEITL